MLANTSFLTWVSGRESDDTPINRDPRSPDLIPHSRVEAVLAPNHILTEQEMAAIQGLGVQHQIIFASLINMMLGHGSICLGAWRYKTHKVGEALNYAIES